MNQQASVSPVPSSPILILTLLGKQPRSLKPHSTGSAYSIRPRNSGSGQHSSTRRAEDEPVIRIARRRPSITARWRFSNVSDIFGRDWRRAGQVIEVETGLETRVFPYCIPECWIRFLPWMMIKTSGSDLILFLGRMTEHSVYRTGSDGSASHVREMGRESWIKDFCSCSGRKKRNQPVRSYTVRERYLEPRNSMDVGIPTSKGTGSSGDLSRPIKRTWHP